MRQNDDAAKQFWKSYLETYAEPTPLPLTGLCQTDVGRPGQVYKSIQRSINKGISAGLLQCAQTQAVSVKAILQTAWGVLLSKYVNQETVVFGGLNTESTEAENSEETVTPTNALPVIVNCKADRTLLDEINSVHQRELKKQPFEHTELITIQRWLGITDRDALFQTLFILENCPEKFIETGENLSIANTISKNQSCYPLLLTITQGKTSNTGTFELEITYDHYYYDHNQIEQLLTHYERVLTLITTSPQQQISQLDLLTPEEKHTLLVEWNDTRAEYPQDQCIHQLFEQQAKRTPEAIAVIFEDQKLSYQELDERSTLLAKYLQYRGVTPDTLIAICFERSLEMVISIFGILKAGGAYVPLDPEIPSERLHYIVEDSGTSIILTQSHSLHQLDNVISTADIIALDRDWSRLADVARQQSSLQRRVQPKNLAYLIYTSGSTGQPKGVMCHHKGLVNRIHWMQMRYHLTVEDRVLQKTPYSFDVSVWEFVWPTCNGAQLVIAQPGKHRDPAYLARYIEDERISTLHFVPSMLAVFLSYDQGHYRYLKRVICSGEELSVSLAKKFHQQLPGVELHNLYGPTEASIDVSAWQSHANFSGSRLPIGKPINNIQLYILDHSLAPVPPGVVGDLFIGGVGVARGYINKMSLTRDCFIKDTFNTKSETKLYKTGDLARWLTDGNIEYLGRVDHQVKIRGFRIELGEIESCLNAYPGIQNSVVIVKEETNDKYLAAYYVSTNKKQAVSLKSQTIKTFLAKQLPAYMIPVAFVSLNEIPLTPNGKIDRRALDEIPIQEKPQQQFELDTTATDLIKSQKEIAEAVVVVDTHSQMRICHYETLEDTYLNIASLRKLAITTLGKGSNLRQFIEIYDWPRQQDGEIDWLVLHNPDQHDDEPQTDMEKSLATIWRSVLNTDLVGRSDNFFDIGGHSLLAAQVIIKIKTELGIEISQDKLLMETLERLSSECERLSADHQKTVNHKSPKKLLSRLLRLKS